MVVDDVNFLENFSIRALKLTLRDILLESSEKLVHFYNILLP